MNTGDGVDPTQGLASLGLRLDIATRAAGLGIWEWDLQTNCFTYSKRAREICGFPESGEVTYEMVSGVTHPDDLPRTRAIAQRAIDPAIRGTEPYVYRIVRQNSGETIWVEAHGEATFSVDDRGLSRAVRYTGTLLDITEKKLAAQQLVDTEARLRLAIEAGRLAVWEIDLATQTVTHSPQLNALCGFPADARPTLDEFRSRYAPGESERINREGGEARARGDRTFQSEVKHIWPDGSEHWLLMRAQVAPGEKGYDGRVIGVLIDVTDRHRQEQMFREMADNAPVVVWVTDENDELTFISRSWEQMTGQKVEEALRKGWLAVIHPDDRARVALASVESARARSRFEVEYRVETPTGGWRWILDTATPRYDASNRFLGHIGSAVDITDRKQQEEDRKLLIGELNHRMKNSLALVQAIAAQTLRNAGVKGTVINVLHGRLQALATAQEAVTAGQWGGSEMRHLFENTLRPFVASGGERIKLAGPSIAVSARASMSFSLAIHEMATNAAKYGALSNPSGRINLRWGVQDDLLTVEWKEVDGPQVNAPERSGFGSILIERVLETEFGGRVERRFPREGVEVRIAVPLPSIQPDSM